MSVIHCPIFSFFVRLFFFLGHFFRMIELELISLNIFLPALKQQSSPKKWYIAIPAVLFLFLLVLTCPFEKTQGFHSNINIYNQYYDSSAYQGYFAFERCH